MVAFAVARDDEDIDLQTITDSIVWAQRQSGMIPWSPSQHCDPWNHVEAAMALCAGGHHASAKRAFDWLASIQRPDGAWFASYHADGTVRERHTDTNAVAYVACGAYHYVQATHDIKFARIFFPVVDRAIDFVLAHQLDSGAIAWSIGQDGTAVSGALLAGSCSIFQSLLAAIHLAHIVEQDRPRWTRCAEQLRAAIVRGGRCFLDKGHYAMDWYYPVLTGILDGDEAVRRLDGGTADFVMDGCGVLCRSDRRWVTAAETAEYAISLTRLEQTVLARRMITQLQTTFDDGGFATGIVYPDEVEFPPGERTTYSAAAVALAIDFLDGGLGTTALFSLSLDPTPKGLLAGVVV